MNENDGLPVFVGVRWRTFLSFDGERVKRPSARCTACRWEGDPKGDVRAAWDDARSHARARHKRDP